MKVLLLLVIALTGHGCSHQTANRPAPVSAARAVEVKPPFRLAIVPTTSSTDAQGITVAREKPDEFYVVLTNVSLEAQPVWSSWNSWGYQNISFEFTMSDGQQIVVSKLAQVFTRNFPSTFLIPPGEHQVYPIRLDKEWNTGPGLSKVAESTITVKAIYELPVTPESTQYEVWAGRVESPSYKFTMRHW